VATAVPVEMVVPVAWVPMAVLVVMAEAVTTEAMAALAAPVVLGTQV
jgi:hypothetical protein